MNPPYLPWRIKRRKPRNGLSMPPEIVDSRGETVCFFGGGAVHFQNCELNARLAVRLVNATQERKVEK